MDRDENPTQTIDACAPDPQTVDRLLGGAHHDPHAVLGAHPHDNGTVVRVLRPHADEHGAWECRECLRVFTVRYIGVLSPSGVPTRSTLLQR